ncbi:Clp protease [Cognatiyoonia koreensis]|uniref:Clp protease n=1 Tax=Cognatiyoonia koreensis TaxID=364200 RepID=A0A1I0PSH8_9RHOB|nr:ATP-dependent Clp protease proteolytic subunit [Cognatiyoonia koreensis]SEW17328.1 Clp protease [Cognatiyoonia koreensis]
MKTYDTTRILRWVFGLQLVFAAVLLSGDLIRVLPQIAFPSSAPELTQPLGPGDQTRRYDPSDITPRQARPGSRPIPVTEDMPSRLLFEYVSWNNEPTVTITGQIGAGDADRFLDFLKDNQTTPVQAYLNSPGGSVQDALAIGREMRRLEMNSAMTASDICLSACPYLLAAGMNRTVEDGALVGVHQHFFGENTALPAFLAVEDIQRGQGEVMAYLDDMGIDPLIMQHALVTPPDEIYLLTPEELERYGLVGSTAEVAPE